MKGLVGLAETCSGRNPNMRGGERVCWRATRHLVGCLAHFAKLDGARVFAPTDPEDPNFEQKRRLAQLCGSSLLASPSTSTVTS